jgi:hypothetical protein
MQQDFYYYSILIIIEQSDYIFRCFHLAAKDLIFYEKLINDLLAFLLFLRFFEPQ